MSQPSEDDDLDRDAKIERLLIAGLDYYFAGEHERAIDVWTRVLFLDRGHTRARAYIERARGALAEQQRESDELIARGMAAFEAGEAADARQLLRAAVAQGGPHDVAVALLERLERLRPSVAAGESPARHRRIRRGKAPSAGIDRSHAWLTALLVLVAIVAAGVYVVVSLPQFQLTQAPGSSAAGNVARGDEQLPIVRTSDLRLSRARTLAASGKMKEALRELEAIGPGESATADADRLRAEIQRSLLADLPAVRR